MRVSEVRLRDPANRVSPRARLVWRVNALVQGVLLTLLLNWVTGWGWHWFSLPWWVWTVYAVLVVGYVAGMPWLRYRVHRWEVSQDAVYTQRGWIGRERRIAPMNRVQTVDVSQGPVSRLVRLAHVTVTTASAAGPLRIEGLDQGVAERLVQDLTERAGLDHGDAT